MEILSRWLAIEIQTSGERLGLDMEVYKLDISKTLEMDVL